MVSWRQVRRRAALSLTAGALALMSCGGCASKARLAEQTSAPDAAVASVPAEATATRDANIIGGTLQLSMLVPMSFSAEPRGDIALDTPTRVYAHVSRVSTSPAAVTFDAEQLYLGGAADEEAKRDHQAPSDSQMYQRNAYKHSQNVSVVASTGVVLQFPREDVDPAYGSDGFSQITATTFDDFANRFSAGDDSVRLRGAGYWIVLDADGVLSIAEQYAP